METYAPCVSKRAVANIGGGCIYPSFDGLWMVGPGVAQKVTTNLYRIEEWAKLNPSTMIADYYDGQYYARYIADEKPRILIFNFTDRDSIVEVDDSADAMFRNEFDGRLYIAKDNKILSWDSNEGSYYESDWQSVDVQLGRPLNFAVAQVHADYAESRPIDTVQVAANEALMANLDAVGGFVCGDEFAAVVVAGSNLVPVSAESSRKVQFTLYKGGTPVFTKSVDSVKPFRLPAGYRTEVVSVGINASSPTYSVTIAESFAELAGAS
jgi:hypothetical protein